VSKRRREPSTGVVLLVCVLGSLLVCTGMFYICYGMWIR
jgi:hypothetical protein